MIDIQPFTVEKGYYCYLNMATYNLQPCYETSGHNRMKENLTKVLILLRLLLIANSCR